MNKKLYFCKPHEVIVLDRQRHKMDPKKFLELKTSIQSKGQLQPGVCRLDEDGSPILVFGERRLKACTELGCEFTYLLKEDLTEAEAFEIELIENIHREDLIWKDRVEAELKLHELRQEQKGETSPGTRGGHRVKDTAEELGQSVGNTQEDLDLARWAREIPEVSEAPNKTIAKNIVRRLSEEINRDEALDSAIKRAENFKTEVMSEAGVELTKELSAQSILEARLLEFDRRSLEGDFEEIYEWGSSRLIGSETFDVVCFDPPWGVNRSKVVEDKGTKRDYEDSQEEVWSHMEKWLSIIYESMKEDSHLYLFFGIIYHQRIYDLLESTGFQVNRMPLFWKKIGSHTIRAPKLWPGRCYEAIAYARKGSKDLAQMGRPDIIETKAPTQALKLSHPSAKHPDIYRDLLRRSCQPGDKVFDPMSGSGMFAVACESLRTQLELDWYICELDSDFRNLGIENLLKGYSKITGEVEEHKTRWLPPIELPADFRELKPGSEEWKVYWNNYPDRQEEMLEWKESQ